MINWIKKIEIKSETMPPWFERVEYVTNSPEAMDQSIKIPSTILGKELINIISAKPSDLSSDEIYLHNKTITTNIKQNDNLNEIFHFKIQSSHLNSNKKIMTYGLKMNSFSLISKDSNDSPDLIKKTEQKHKTETLYSPDLYCAIEDDFKNLLLNPFKEQVLNNDYKFDNISNFQEKVESDHNYQEEKSYNNLDTFEEEEEEEEEDRLQIHSFDKKTEIKSEFKQHDSDSKIKNYILDHGDFIPSSVTPEINNAEQYRIPFTLLKTDKTVDNYENPAEAQKIIEKLEETLEEFGVEARVVGLQKGPIITRYELKIPPGIKVNRILSLSDELAMALEAIRVRIEAPIPGRSTIGIEIPNQKRARVLLGDIMNHQEYKEFGGNLPLPLGKDISGNLLLEDLCKMPHLLIAGATGSGKSVAINAFITSLILSKSPEQVRLLLVDPKLVELSHFNDIPHLLHPVIVDPQKAILALNWAVEEMERRYEDMAEMRSRDIFIYNEKIKTYNKNSKKSKIAPMPYIIVLIDELGDLMMVAGKEVESSIIRLSQKARAVGIHLILATQRPSVDVITALIKANCPARIALQVAQKTDSRTILDSNGGEQLLGQGDMLFKHPSKAQLIRAQSPLVEDIEVENVVEMIKKSGKPSYITLEDPKANLSELEAEDESLFEEAWNIIKESNKASASYLQRRLRIGYNRAARLIEAFEARGYIGPQIGSKPRDIIM